ncbi:MAG TPA: 2-amino-4-hydroxy-6-hydroxymethyldihydropteridine diphosphokinase [Clostridiales bacterium]|nr:2-amino-4-hydroxy-6-hydroxymethyldihydropteridine diphosphokinase [Clostridiales bacterium]
MNKAILGIGSNLGNRTAFLSSAVRAIEQLPETTVLAESSRYETKPYNVPDEQNDYLNECIVILTALSPRALLGACLGIEAALGRVREKRHGSRVIDIDLLIYENATSKDAELTLPHPGILKRLFVLLPLSDLYPSGNALGLDFSAALKRVDRSKIKVF